jgi:hypothetical protein
MFRSILDRQLSFLKMTSKFLFIIIVRPPINCRNGTLSLWLNRSLCVFTQLLFTSRLLAPFSYQLIDLPLTFVTPSGFLTQSHLYVINRHIILSANGPFSFQTLPLLSNISAKATMSSQLRTIPARKGIATPLRAGQTVKIINTHGTQVVDTWAFSVSWFPLSPSSTIVTQMSMQHTRASLNRIIPKVGDGLYDNERRKMLTITEDTTEGVHDTLIAACDAARYRELGGEEGHRNCADNLVEGLGALDMYPFPFLSWIVCRSLVIPLFVGFK